MSLVRIPREIKVPQKKTYTATFEPSGFDSVNSVYNTVSSSYPISNGYAGSSSTTYAQFTAVNGSQAETYIYYTFDLSSIPANATIKSVSVQAKTYISSTSSSYVSVRQVQMCSGTTPKGSATNMTNTSGGTTDTLSVGEWTRAELQNAKLRLYVKRGTSQTSTARNIRLYGATLTVEYETY